MENKISYGVKNFKAFEDSGKIQIAPITVLSGENSSGKSSLLKSFLLIKQSYIRKQPSISKNTQASPLVLNGEWVNLGSWTDTVYNKERDRCIDFNWSFSGDVVSEDGAMFYGFSESKKEKFLFDLSVSIESEGKEKEEISSSVKKSRIRSEGIEINLVKDEGRCSELAAPGIYKVRVGNFGKVLQQSPRVGYMFYAPGFFEARKILQSSGDEIELGDVSVSFDGPFLDDIRPRFNESWVPTLNQIRSAIETKRKGKRGRIPAWLTRLNTDVEKFEKYIKNRKIADEEDGQYEDDIVNFSSPIIGLALSLVMSAGHIFKKANRCLAPVCRNIRYLGPLRDEPHRFYQFNDTGGVEIGFSGEFTVQVLSIEKDRSVASSHVEYLSNGTINLISKESSPLFMEMNYWMSLFGLPKVEPKILEQSLYKLSVGDLGVSLPDVGFGVSQILPIIVEVLRAQEGETVILEQPEIHLHPRIQALLADFFIARANDGVKFIIESHSEYFIKRLCRRVAERSIPGVTDMVNILFISKRETGGSLCEEVAVNEFGEIENWPRGFFDQTEDLYWTRAAMKNRRSTEINK